MKDVGIRDLKARASELIRHVAEDLATYTITRRGRAVGVLAPPDFVVPDSNATDQDAWKRLRRLAEKLGRQTGARSSALRALERSSR